MASAVKYIANVGKSVKYATIDALKELNPVINDTIETNQDILKVTYSSIKNFKTLSAKAMKTFSESQVGELAKDLKKNLMEDIKNGTFYNKKRETEIESKIIDEEYGASMDDFFLDEDSFSSDDMSVEDTIEDVGEKTTTAVSNVLARTAEYQVEATRQSTNRILAQTAAMSATLHSDLGVLNANVSGLMKFNNEAMTTHIENSRAFYERQQQQMSEQTSILKEILEFQKSIYAPKEKSKTEKMHITDALTSGGSIDLEGYFKIIKSNLKNLDNMGLTDMISAGGSSGGIKAIVANPLGMIMTEAIKGVMPVVFKNAMQEFNETISGSISTAILNASKARNSSNPIMSLIGNIFGVDLSNNKQINPSKYNKEATAWNGKDHKALTEVIPTLLNKIYSSVSGKEEQRYDYDKGKFISISEIESSFNKSKNRYVSDANDNILPYFEKMISKMSFDSTDRQKEFIDNIETILKENFKNMRYANPYDTSIDAKSYGLKGEHAEQDLAAYRKMLAKIPKHKQLKNNNDLLEAHGMYNKWLSDLENQGDSIYMSLVNNSIDKSKSSTVVSPLFATASKLDTTNAILIEIRDILSNKNSGKRINRTTKNTTKVNNNVVSPLDKNTANSTSSTKKDEYLSDLGIYVSTSTNENATFNPDKDDFDSFNFDEKTENPNSYISRLKKADKPSKKMFAFLSGTKELVQQPLYFFSNVLRKVDERMYTLLFGSDKEGKKSILGKITNGIDMWLEDLKDTTRQKFDDFKEWLTGKSIGDKAHDIFSKLFGIDTREWFKDFRKAAFGDKNMSFGEGVRKIFGEGFSDIWKDIKDTFKSDDAIQSAKDAILGEKTKEGEEVAQGQKKFDSLGKFLNREERKRDQQKETKDGTGKTEPIDNAAKGMRRVSKTGIVAVSEGEMIIPPDLNPYNIRKREKAEKDAINKFESVYGKFNNIQNFATGGTVENPDDERKKKLDLGVQRLDSIVSRGSYDVKKLINMLSQFDQEGQQYILNNVKDKTLQVLRENYKKARELYRPKSLGREGYVKGKENILYKMQDSAKDIISEAKENEIINNMASKITSKFTSKNKDMSEESKEVVNDIMSNFSQYLPKVAAGGVTGWALSAMLGLAGGPLVGAAFGSALGLISKSKTLQRWLFGEKITDEEGNEKIKGGILGDDIKKNIHKYFPNMAKGAVVGGITSILPFVPGGPVAGIVVGSAIGFAKSNDNLREKLFGEDKVLSKINNVIKSKLPRMGLSAAAMFLGGPFGVTTNLMVGSALGFVSDTEKFKDIVFGTKGFDGKRRGGLVGFIKDAAEIPINGIKDLFSYARDWFKKDILDPIGRFLKPAFQDLKNLGSWIADGVKSAFSDHLLKPIGGTILSKIIRPIEEKLGKLINPFIKGFLGLLSSPFRALGKFGDWRRSRQLRSVGGAAGSISDRVMARAELDSNTKPSLFRRAVNGIAGREVLSTTKHVDSKANKLDMTFLSMTNEDRDMAGTIAELYSNNRLNKKNTKKVIEGNIARLVHKQGGLDKVIYSHVDRTDPQMVNDYTNIKKEILSGKVAGSISILNAWVEAGKFPAEFQSVAISELKRVAKLVRDRRKKLENAKEYAAELKDKYGIDLNDRKHRKVAIQSKREIGVDDDNTMAEYFSNVVDEANAGTIEDRQLEVAFKMEKIQQEISTKLTDINDTLNKMLDVSKGINDDSVTDVSLDSSYGVEQDARAVSGNKLLPAIYTPFPQQQEETVDEEYKKYKPNFTLDDEGTTIATRLGRVKYAWDNKYKDKFSILINAIDRAIMANQGTVKVSASDVIAAAQAGDYSAANDLASGKVSNIDKLKRIGRRISNKIKVNASKSKSIITENGPIKTRIDTQGNEIPDERDSETKNTLAIVNEQRQTQKGILAKISGLGDTIKNFFGFGKKDEEEEDSLFSKIIKGALKYTLPILGGLAGIGLVGSIADKKVKVKKRDQNGKVIYDDNGNPVMVEDTLANAVGSAIQRVWFGEDLTGNTSGIWFGIKGFTRDSLIPAIGSGIDIILKTLPNLIQKGVEIITNHIPTLVEGLVSAAIEHAPSIIWAGVKGLVSGLSKALASIFGGNSEKSKAEDIENMGFTATTGLVSDTDTSKESSKYSTWGSASPTAQKIVDQMQKSMDGKTSDYIATSIGYTNSNSSTKPLSMDPVKVGNSAGTTPASKETYSQIKLSKAYTNTNTAAQEKVLDQLAPIWNTQTKSGVTVGELLNSDDIVVGSYVDDNGKTHEVTGSNLLDYPELANQVLGVDIALSDEERDEQTEETNPGIAFDRGIGGKILKYGDILTRIKTSGGRSGKAIGLTAKLFRAPYNLLGNALLKKSKKLNHPTWKLVTGMAGAGVKAAGRITTFPADIIDKYRKKSKANFDKFMSDRAAAKTASYMSKTPALLTDTLDPNIEKFGLDDIDDVIDSSGNSVYKSAANTVDAVTDIGDDITTLSVNSRTATNASKSESGLKKAFSKFKNKIGNSKFVSKATEFANKIKQGIIDFLSDNKVVKKLAEMFKSCKATKKAVESTVQTFIDKIANLIGDQAEKALSKLGVKAASKLSGKLAGYLATGGFAFIVSLVVYFLQGIKNADAIMQAVDPTIAERVVAGIANALVKGLGIDILFDTSFIVSLIVGALEFFGVDFTDLRERQAEAKRLTDEYNNKTGANLSPEEFLMSDKIETKVKNFIAGIGKGISGAAKTVGNVVSTFGKSVISFFTGKSDDNTDENKQYIYDDNGNVVGEDTNGDGNPDRMFISQGSDPAQDTLQTATDFNSTGVPSTETTELSTEDQTQAAATGTGSVISSSNSELINKAYADINNDIPNMIRQLKANLAKYFGVDQSDLDRTTKIGANKYKGSSPEQLFQRLRTMWSQVNTRIAPFTKQLPNTLYSGIKELSRFLAVNMGFADPKDEDVDLNELVKNESYVDQRAEQVARTSPFTFINGIAGTSSTNPKIIKESAEDMQSENSDKANTETFTSKITNGVKGLLRGIGNFFGIGGSGSGMDEPIAETDNKLTDKNYFISQTTGQYANKPFTVSGDRSKETVADAGCAPAVATMAINAAGYSASPITMDEAMKTAIEYKKPNNGVTADYFIDEFDKHGLNAAYVTSKNANMKSSIIKRLTGGTPIILMGRDEKNKSKSASPFGPKTHYVVATGISPDKNTIYVNDPEASKPRIPYKTSALLNGVMLGIAPVIRSNAKSKANSMINKIKKMLARFSASGKYGEDTPQYKVWTALRAADYNEIAVAAVMGNIQHESGFDASVIEKGSGAGFGLVQWTDDRRTALENYAAQQGKDVASLDFQIEYLLKELEPDSGIWTGSDSRYGFGSLSRDSWLNSTDIETATKAFMACFERPDYSSSINHIDQRIQSAKEYYEEFTGTAVPEGTTTTGGTDDETGTSSSGKQSPIDVILSSFSKLASVYGLSGDSSSGSTSIDSSSSSSSSTLASVDGSDITGNVSDNEEFAQKQIDLVKQMKSVEGKLAYSWGPGTKYPGPSRNPDDGYADCSSTVQWAYQKVLGKDVGGWTGAQETSPETVQVATDVNDQSKLQLGDLLLYRRNGNSSHVEMYYSTDKMIGHGGPGAGPTVKPLAQDTGTQQVAMVKRYKDFVEGGSGSGIFVSQRDNKYANKTIGSQTVADAGCAPAVATMAISSANNNTKYSMDTAIRDASKYNSASGGVTGDYFVDAFTKNGMIPQYAKDNDSIIKNLTDGNQVVLLGQDSRNTSKNRSPFGPTSHYVLATGISKDKRYIYINDPEAKRGNIRYRLKDILSHTTFGLVPKKGDASKLSEAALNKVRSALRKFSGKADKSILYVGDSRTVGLQNALGDQKNISFIAKESMGYDWLKSTADAGIRARIKAASSLVVIFAFGVNDLHNIDKYIAYYQKLAEDTGSKNIWYMSVNPTSGPVSVSNSMIEEFNAKLKKFAGDRYIDTYTYLKENGFNATDGIHYDSKTYLKIHGYCLSVINGTPTIAAETNNTDDSNTETTEDTNPLNQILSAFNNLAVAYGLKSESGSTETSSDSGSSNDSGSGDYSGSNSEEQVWSYFKNKGIPAAGIAGLMGNIKHESGFQFNNVENLLEQRLKEAGKSYNTDDSYTKAVDDNTIDRAEFLNPFPGKQYGYGLVQWTSPGRKAGLYDLVKSRNTSIADPGSQMDWLWEELSNSYKGVLDTMKTSNDVRTVSTKVLKDFESPADTGSSMQQLRYDSSKAYYDKYKDMEFDTDKEDEEETEEVSGSGSGLTTPTMKSKDTPSFNYGSSTPETITVTQPTTSNQSNNTDRLIEVVVKLLAQVVNNTSSIKDIASLLVKLIDIKSNNTGTSTGSSDLSKTAAKGAYSASQLALQALRQSTSTTEDEEIAKLIRSVEAIAMQ